jgi:hypothetical protein
LALKPDGIEDDRAELRDGSWFMENATMLSSMFALGHDLSHHDIKDPQVMQVTSMEQNYLKLICSLKLSGAFGHCTWRYVIHQYLVEAGRFNGNWAWALFMDTAGPFIKDAMDARGTIQHVTCGACVVSDI